MPPAYGVIAVIIGIAVLILVSVEIYERIYFWWNDK